MAASPPPATPARAKGAGSNPLTRKLGPAPLWVWLAAGAGLYVAYRHFAGTATSAGTLAASPSSATPLTTNAAGDATNAGASGGGGASPADSLNADLFSQLFGYLGVQNADLTNALVSQSSAITGLGAEALAENGALEQAIISSYTPRAPSPTIATAPALAAPSAPKPAPAPSYSAPYASIGLPQTVSGETTIGPDVTTSVTEALAVGPTYGAVVPVNQPTPPTYGITSGPTAGSRASSNTKQGVYTVH